MDEELIIFILLFTNAITIMYVCNLVKLLPEIEKKMDHITKVIEEIQKKSD
ncbi:MAG: hypothetical protein ACRC0X_08280 [Brevinema sp.]